VIKYFLFGGYMSRVNISSGAKWESIVGYSRVVRVGSSVVVSGTTAFTDDGQIVGIEDPYRQTIQILKTIEKALAKAGAAMKDIIRTRIYVTNIEYWEAIGKAHGEFFREIKPATTMIEVSRLIDPEILVEIEADAIIEET
jgi:enamine deaminase RidA (YjgF/YER057c/UK114 family)